MKAIFKREFKAYFPSPIGYIFLAAIWFISGLNFTGAFSAGAPEIPQLLSDMSWILLLVVSIIVMRSFSEDRGKKIDQALLTAPIKLPEIVFGKFFAALSIYALSLSTTLIFEIIMLIKVPSASFINYLYALFGMLLFGAALISIGMFISSLTESTAVAGIANEIINLLFLFMPTFSYFAQSKLNSAELDSGFKGKFATGAWTLVSKCLSGLDITDRLTAFSKQVFSVADVIYMLSFTVVFLFLCVRSLEKKRWA